MDIYVVTPGGKLDTTSVQEKTKALFLRRGFEEQWENPTEKRTIYKRDRNFNYIS